MDVVVVVVAVADWAGDWIPPLPCAVVVVVVVVVVLGTAAAPIIPILELL